MRQVEVIIPEWLFNEDKHLLSKRIEKVYNLKPLKQIVRGIFKTDDKKLVEGLAEKMINPYYFVDKIL